MREKTQKPLETLTQSLRRASRRVMAITGRLALFGAFAGLVAGCTFRDGVNATKNWFIQMGQRAEEIIHGNYEVHKVPVAQVPTTPSLTHTTPPVVQVSQTPKPVPYRKPTSTPTPTATPTPTPKPTETSTPTATATEEAPSPVESYKAFNELMDQEFENLKNGKTFRLKGNGTTTIYKQAGHFVENILTAMLEDATGKKFPAGIISVIVDDKLGPQLRPVLVGPLHAVVIQKQPMILYNSGSNVPHSGIIPPFVWHMSNKKSINSVVEGLGEFAQKKGQGGDLAGEKVPYGTYKNTINRYTVNEFEIFFFIPRTNGDIVIYEYNVETNAVVNSRLYDATIRATGKFILNDKETLDRLVALDPNNPADYKEIQNLLLAQGISFSDRKALEAFFKAEVETYAASGGVR